MSARALCRQHGAPYLRPSAGRERLAGICGALLLTACLTLPGAWLDKETDVNPFPDTIPLSAKPAPITADERLELLHTLHRRRVLLPITGRDTCNGECETAVGCLCQTAGLDCNQGRACPVPVPQAAECCTDLGAEPAGRHRSTWISRAWLWLQRAIG